MPTVYLVINRLIYFYELIVFVYCVLTWVPSRGEGPLYDFRLALAQIVEPFLGLFRRIVPPIGGMDFSPVAAFFVLALVERLIATILLG